MILNNMNVEINEYKNHKKFNFKHIIFLIIAISIIISSIVCIVGISLKQNKEISKTKEIVGEENNVNENIVGEQPIVVELEERTILPIFNENAKDEIKHIYKSDEKRVFLTFDDGPSNTVTPIVLDVLKDNNIKATFFVLGSRVELYPELLQREYNEGHFIANHGYSHKYSSIYANVSNVIDEYNKTEECIKIALGKPEYSSHLFRFPGGSSGGKYANLKKEAIELLDNNNIAHVDWNALSRDAEGNFNKEQLYNNVVQTTTNKNSVVLLMHDAGGKISTAEALRRYYKLF